MYEYLIYEDLGQATRKSSAWRQMVLGVARFLADTEALRTWGAPLPPASEPEPASAGPAPGRVA